MRTATALSVAVALALVLSAAGRARAQSVVINEIRIDEPAPSPNLNDYFELAGIPGTALDGLTYLVIGDNGTSNGGAIESVTSLDGLSIAADGFLLVAGDQFTLGTPDATRNFAFENNDTLTHVLVNGFTGMVTDDLDTNDDGTLDATPWGSVLDVVAIVGPTAPPAFDADFPFGAALGGSDVGPDGAAFPLLIYRNPDRTGPWVIGNPDPTGVDADGTPGAPNVTGGPTPIPLPPALAAFPAVAAFAGVVAWRLKRRQAASVA